MSAHYSKTLYKNQSGKVGYWKVEVFGWPEGAELLITHAKTLDGKPVEAVVPVEPKNIGRANETTPLQQAISEAESRVNKQRDRGYVDTPEQAAAPVTNALGKKKPMLATDIDKVKPESIDWDNAWVQPKLDGHRCLNDDGIYSRGGKPHNVQHISDAIWAAGWGDILLDGELYCHGVALQTLGSWIKKPQEDSLRLTYYVYDLVSDEPFEDRLARLRGLFYGSNVAKDFLQLVPTIQVRSMAEALKLVQGWVDQGYEGGILRHGTTGYEDDKRSKSLLKLKQFSDMEVTVIGYRLGTPKVVDGVTYQQPVLRYVTDDGKEGEVLAHGTVPEKHAVWELLESADDWSRRLTIEHFGFTKAGVPNIATAKCWYEPL